jgi:hypothetical protein
VAAHPGDSPHRPLPSLWWSVHPHGFKFSTREASLRQSGGARGGIKTASSCEPVQESLRVHRPRGYQERRVMHPMDMGAGANEDPRGDINQEARPPSPNSEGAGEGKLLEQLSRRVSWENGMCATYDTRRYTLIKSLGRRSR